MTHHLSLCKATDPADQAPIAPSVEVRLVRFPYGLVKEREKVLDSLSCNNNYSKGMSYIVLTHSGCAICSFTLPVYRTANYKCRICNGKSRKENKQTS